MRFSIVVLPIGKQLQMYVFLAAVVKVVATPDSALELPFTAENVESALDEIRPYLMSDGGNVALHEINGNAVRLKLQVVVGAVAGLEMTEENIEKVVEEIRPYLAGPAGGTLEFVAIEDPKVKIGISGPAAGVMTVRVAVTSSGVN
uniref:NIF system FeS cluster assembly NifU C-terminal domain-containing protein n=1 Tax=Kalanchoe fedtschenkoi TaxID=63787 RepID=A0A7N0SWH2_KALFE